MESQPAARTSTATRAPTGNNRVISRRRDVVLALESVGSIDSHARSFARLLYERLSSTASVRDPGAVVDVEAVIQDDDVAEGQWAIQLETTAYNGDMIVQAMQTPVAPRIDGGRRLRWHLLLLVRMIRYLLILPSMQYRAKPGFLAGIPTFIKSVLSGLFLIITVPLLYALSAGIAIIELRLLRYAGSVVLTAGIFGVFGLLIWLGIGETLFVEAVRGLQSFSASVTLQLDEPTIPEASLFQVIAAGATSLFIAVIYTSISLLKRLVGLFVSLEQDEADRSDLTRLLSPTHGAEFEAVLGVKLAGIERELKPDRIYIMCSGTNVILTYRALARLCGKRITTPVTLLTWKATMSEGATYGMDKLWMLLDRNDWSRFTVTAPPRFKWVHLGATWNLLDNFKRAFKDPEGEVLCQFEPQPVSSARALFFANRSTAAQVLSSLTLDAAEREGVRRAAIV